MERSYYAHGKVLLTGEYLVMQGALAMALPSKLGQHLHMKQTAEKDNTLHWLSKNADGSVWADMQFEKENLRMIYADAPKEVSDTLQNILREVRKRNPAFVRNAETTEIITELEFDRNWGLGSSSTLIYNIAQAAHIDPFDLHAACFNGSGYDIACAKTNGPILYRIDDEGRIFDSVYFHPPAKENMLFVYLGNKQNSQDAVTQFNADKKKYKEEVEIISEISEAILFCDAFADFMQLLDEHEEVMQFVLQTEKIKTERFPDFPGVIKSLGAWGGDFVLAASDMDPKDMRSYFSKKGLTTMLSYDEMVLSPEVNWEL